VREAPDAVRLFKKERADDLDARGGRWPE